MDDGLILNLVVEPPASTRITRAEKGGKKTERSKVGKRKADTPESRPSKKARFDTNLSSGTALDKGERAAPSGRPPAQIISSLFTSNPKVDQPSSNTHVRTQSKPSNAPLADSPTFCGLGLDRLIETHLSTKMSISKPTSIQRAALPVLLSASTEDISRDVFIQSQTGSGKTLSFLLPIVQDLLPLSAHSYIDRSIGTLAIVIVPTRELAKQISDVVDMLLKLRLRPSDEDPNSDASGPRLTRWLVSGLLTGGSTRTHEKARLRKGCPILVSTPGRLLDHLQNTSSFNVGKCRWLVLDEADRLMDLGFEETIQGIVKGLEGRRRLALKAVEEGKSAEVGGWDWDRRRRTILCSATIKDDVQKLAGTTLVDPVVIKAVQDDSPASRGDGPASSGNLPAPTTLANTKFTPPSQLSQKYTVVPLKLRLVTLVALLRSLLGQDRGGKGTKIIVFFSCTDSVDFHWKLLGGSTMGHQSANPTRGTENELESDSHQPSSGAGNNQQGSTTGLESVALQSPLLPGTSIYRLHGSLPLQARLASLQGFSKAPTAKDPPAPRSSILLCTSVASRGLDLPLVRAVVQYDLPTEGGATEYIHRVGRTARVGKGGEAWAFVSPSEVEWIRWITAKSEGDTGARGSNSSAGQLEAVGTENVLKIGYGGKGTEYEERATEVQLSFERWVLRDKQHTECARKAYLSHMRAYATHPSDEKHIFHIRHLHLGHLAKSFALRDAPKVVTSTKGSENKPRNKPSRMPSKQRRLVGDIELDTEARMEQAVRVQGRLTKKRGEMVSSGISEFQVASGYDLEHLIQGS